MAKDRARKLAVSQLRKRLTGSSITESEIAAIRRLISKGAKGTNFSAIRKQLTGSAITKTELKAIRMKLSSRKKLRNK